MWPFGNKKTQERIASLEKALAEKDSGIVISHPKGGAGTVPNVPVTRYFESDILFNRAVNLIVGSCSSITVDIKDKLDFPAKATIRRAKLNTILNFKPNSNQSKKKLYSALFSDLLVHGSAFLYWDGAELFCIPAAGMTLENNGILNSRISYTYNGNGTPTEFTSDEIIHIKDTSLSMENSDLQGQSRLNALASLLRQKKKLAQFREKHFDNGTMVGLVIESPEPMNTVQKDRIIAQTELKYNPATGKHSVMVLDNGASAKPLTTSSMGELKITEDINAIDTQILNGLGIPTVMYTQGNNANIRPNVEMFWNTTVLSLFSLLEEEVQLFFGYDIKVNESAIRELRKDSVEHFKAVQGLANNGIITPNEAREMIRKEKITEGEVDMDAIRVPVNIAGSAIGVSGEEGGKPANEGAEE